MIKTICRICGKDIECLNEKIARRRITCSRQCKGVFNKISRGYVYVNCLQCNRSFLYHPDKTKGKYCSKICCLAGQKESRIKKHEEKFKEGKLSYRRHIYKILLQRDGNKCAICGLTEWNGNPIRLWVDHIDGDPSNNIPENFRLICPNCESQTETSRGKNYGKGRISKGLKPYS